MIKRHLRKKAKLEYLKQAKVDCLEDCLARELIVFQLKKSKCICTRVPKCQKSWEGISLLTYVVCIHNLHPKAVKQLFYLWNFSMNFNEKQKLCTVYGDGGSKRPAAGCTLPFAHYLLMIIVFRAMNRLDTFFFLCCSSHSGWPVVRRIEMSSSAL